MIGKTHAEVIKEVNQFLEMDKETPASRCIVGHNIVAFDVKFLHAMWEQEAQTFPAHLYLDTLTMTKHFLKTHTIDETNLPKTARGKVSTRLLAALQITGAQQITKQSHTAKSDTRNTFMLWKKLVEDHQMDYLPHIKNIPHHIKQISEDENFNDYDLSEVE
jgi:DNA polymerase III alpha subunit (gram-positive type)